MLRRGSAVLTPVMIATDFNWPFKNIRRETAVAPVCFKFCVCVGQTF